MLWYNNPEIVEAIRDGRGVSTVDDNKRLMRLSPSQSTDA